MSHHHDTLPHSAGVSALVRRVTMRLSCELAFSNHPPLTLREAGAMFDLGDAVEILDRIAILPGMAQHENRARRDLLEIYDIFQPLDLLEQTVEQPIVGATVAIRRPDPVQS